MFMFKRVFSIVLLIAVICTSFFTNDRIANAINNQTEIGIENVESVLHIESKGKEKTEIIIKYKGSTSKSKKDEVRNNVKSKLNLSKLEIKSQTDRFEVLEIDVSDNINRLLEELNSIPNVEYAQPNYPLEILDFPDEPYITIQWAVYNSGQTINDIKGTPGIDINVVPAWNTTKGEGLIVGILDTGIDIMHEDLRANIYINPYEIPDNGIDDDQNGYIDDANGWDFYNGNCTVSAAVYNENHGTHIAGIIGADNNTLGIIGVAPDVTILPLKFIQGSTGYTSDAIEAIEYAESMGVSIINCSFGSYTYNPALKETMANSNMIFVCAAGNDGTDEPLYPASFDLDNVISVGAINNKGERAAFSNFGNHVDIYAPGKDIMSTLGNQDYGFLSGTSMAAPYVAGVLAQCLSLSGKQVNHAETKIKLIETGKRLNEEILLVDADCFLQSIDIGVAEEDTYDRFIVKTSHKSVIKKIIKLLSDDAVYSELPMDGLYLVETAKPISPAEIESII